MKNSKGFLFLLIILVVVLINFGLVGNVLAACVSPGHGFLSGDTSLCLLAAPNCCSGSTCLSFVTLPQFPYGACVAYGQSVPTPTLGTWVAPTCIGLSLTSGQTRTVSATCTTQLCNPDSGAKPKDITCTGGAWIPGACDASGTKTYTCSGSVCPGNRPDPITCPNSGCSVCPQTPTPPATCADLGRPCEGTANVFCCGKNVCARSVSAGASAPGICTAPIIPTPPVTPPTPANISFTSDHWVIGSDTIFSKIISWDKTAFAGNVDIQLCTSGHTADCFYLLASDLYNSGSVSLTIPSTITNVVIPPSSVFTPGNDYTVSVRNHNGNSETNQFSSKKVKIVSLTCASSPDVNKECGRTGITVAKNCSPITTNDECYCTKPDSNNFYFSKSCFNAPLPPTLVPRVDNDLGGTAGRCMVSDMNTKIPGSLVWAQGDTRGIGFVYSNFGLTKTNPNQGASLVAQTPIDVWVNSVAIFLCNPNDQSKCVLFGGGKTPLENRISMPGTGKNVSGYQAEKIGQSALFTINNNQSSDFAKAFAPALVDSSIIGSTTMVKVCPSITTVPCPASAPGSCQPGVNPLIGTVPTGAVCAYSPVFTVIDPNDAHSPTWDLPAGQGCIVGECVCVGGKAARCGNPMDLVGKGCKQTPSCAAGPSASIGGRLMASLGALLNNFVGLFKW